MPKFIIFFIVLQEILATHLTDLLGGHPRIFGMLLACPFYQVLDSSILYLLVQDIVERSMVVHSGNKQTKIIYINIIKPYYMA